MALRSLMVPAVQLGSWVGPIVFMGGFLFANESIALIGLLLFAATAVFAIVTIPVEMDASKRAKAMLASTGIVQYGSELQGVDQVLDAAALTYVAGAVQVVSTLLYYALLLFGGRRRN